ncbi:hypothetical protein L596_016606 [Steinernema carpocapsae]|uniref:Small ribosomal subunit protein eS25 n=1 Tax=Steinernema carpocapsae TaxID=34508 RepID=A0A4U5NIJ8_STECR|nr:hypothetical protein L596_016606 [Steinernema carpocapsae]
MPPKTSKKADAKGGKPVKKDSSGGKGKKKKWSKGKVRDKLNNMALFDKATYDKLYKEVSAPRSLALPNPISAPGRDLQAHHPIGCFRTSEGPCLACQAGSSRLRELLAKGLIRRCQPQQPTGLHPCHQDRRNRRLSTSLLLVFVSNKVFIPFINRVFPNSYSSACLNIVCSDHGGFFTTSCETICEARTLALLTLEVSSLSFWFCDFGSRTFAAQFRFIDLPFAAAPSALFAML